MQGRVFGGMAVKSKWGALPSALYRPISGTRHWILEEGAGKLSCGFSFLALKDKNISDEHLLFMPSYF